MDVYCAILDCALEISSVTFYSGVKRNGRVCCLWCTSWLSCAAPPPPIGAGMSVDVCVLFEHVRESLHNRGIPNCIRFSEEQHNSSMPRSSCMQATASGKIVKFASVPQVLNMNIAIHCRPDVKGSQVY